MSVEVLSRFFALLALATNVFVVGTLLVLLAARVSPGAADLGQRVQASLDRSGLGLAWLVAAVAMGGSLYYSEIAGYPPCALCWYQRIAMYPMVVILGVAAMHRDLGVRRYVLPVIAIGAAISVYHYALEWNPSLEFGACTLDIPCSAVWVREFGFVSIPYMALSGFAAIATALLVASPEESS